MISTIRSKILLAFIVMSLLTGGLGWYAVHGIRHAGDLVVETFDKSLMSINYARAAATDFAEMQKRFASRDASVAPMPTDDAKMADMVETLEEDLGIAAERAQSAQATGAAQKVREAAAAWREAATRGDRIALEDAAHAVDAQIDLLVNFTAGDGFAYRERALSQISSEHRLNIAATVGALMMAAFVTWMLARRIIGPVAAASRAASRIANGELDTEIPPGGRDELGALLGAMSVMRDNIRNMMNSEIAQRRSAQARLLAAVESSGEGVLLVDNDGLIAVANSQIARFFPRVAPLLAPGTPFARMIETAVDDGCFAVTGSERPGLIERLRERRVSVIEQRLADGRWLRIGRSATQEGGLVLICVDITAIKQHEAELERTNLWFSTALDNMSQGLVLFDAENRLQVANRRFAELHDLTDAPIAPGMSYRALVDLVEPTSSRADALHHERMTVIARREPCTTLQTRADGRQLVVTHEPMPDGGWIATFEDVTARKQAEARLDYIARHDVLTGLANREALDARLSQALAEPRDGFALLCLDLDQFKAVNDALGHAVGDRVLCEAAARLQDCVGAQDLVARLGGDEFAVLHLSLTRAADTVVLAQEILARLQIPYDIDGQIVVCGTSIGIAVAPGDGDSSEALLRNADTALHRAKTDGRAIYRFFEPDMDAKLQARRLLELDLRHALEDEAFQLFYQPLIEARTERVCGFEALLRWHHPTRGMVSPAEFIPVAEECGLIVPIGAWVLQEACREAMTWPDDVKVAVNVSPIQFKNPLLVETVMDALDSSGLPAQRLEIEITESVLLHDSASVMTTLKRLHDLGLRISMDDFGTGYSSLGYLRSFPFDKIKIDQSFVRDLGTKADSRAIVRAIVGMGLSLGMRITAEGVEEEAQLAMLRAEGCTEIQGYYYSKPRPSRELAGIFEKWGRKLALEVI